MRIMPRVNEQVNEDWISDKTRFIWDGLRSQRLDRPYVRRNGRLIPASWPEAFDAIKAAVAKTSGEKIGAIAGDLAAVEEMYALKLLMQSLGSPNLDCRQDGAALDPALGRASYVFNPTIEGIEHADAVLIIGSNPRFEASVLNARIRKRWRIGGLPVGVIGNVGDTRYEYEQLGAGPETLKDLAGGNGKFFDVLKKAERPLVIVGQGALARADGAAVLGLAAKLAGAVGAVSVDWNGFAVLHTAAARVGGLDLGFVPGEGGKDVSAMMGALDVLFLLGADEFDMNAVGSALTIYIGTHGDAGAHRADVILPASAYTEKSGTYVNTEGRVQMTSRAGFAPGQAKEDWAVIRALSDVLGHRLPFDSLAQLRAKLYADHPHFAGIDQIADADAGAIAKVAKIGGRIGKASFETPVKDFYLTNPIARASAVMAECSALAKDGFKQAAE
jgi:NADH-quinone oxidoreductase subunit G